MVTRAIAAPRSRDCTAARRERRTKGRSRTAATITTTRPARENATSPARTPVVAMAETTESRIQPTMSSIIAALSVSWPTSRWMSLSSIRVLAMTGIALTPMATPMNSPNVLRSVPPGTSAAGTRRPVHTPRPSGTTSPATLIRAEVPPRRRTSFRSMLSPVRPTSRMTPICPTASSRWNRSADCGSSQLLKSGATCASTDGPSSSPAHSSPTMAGIPRRSASLPSRKASESNSPTWSRKRNRSCPPKGTTGAAETVMRTSARARRGKGRREGSERRQGSERRA